MTPQRRTALVSIVAAAALVVLKLGAGLASGSLGLVSEALHSGTDLVAALLTFFAIGVAGLAVARLVGAVEVEVDPAWWAFAVVGAVIAIDLYRTSASLRTARAYK